MQLFGFRVSSFLFFLLFFSVFVVNGQITLYVSPDGSPTNTGEEDNPLTLQAAIDRVETLLSTGQSSNGYKILLSSGDYLYNERFVLGDRFIGTEQSPISIEALPGANVEFDGGASISSGEFKPVTDSIERTWLAPSAVDKILTVKVTDSRLVEILEGKLLTFKLNINGKAYDPTVFPNDQGTNRVKAYLENEPLVEEVSPPGALLSQLQVNGNRTGQGEFQEPGKPLNWYGSIEEPRGAVTRMTAESEALMGGTWEQWEAEIKRNNKRNFMQGLIEAVWKFNNIEIYEALADQRAIRLAKVLQYSFRWAPEKGSIPYKEFKLYGLLCELDKPGEWYFDVDTKKLYVYPPDNSGDVNVSLPLADGLFELKAATSYVTIKGISAKNVRGSAVYDVNGSNNTIASATVRNCAASGVRVFGSNNMVNGCTFVDLNSHAQIRGGSVSTGEFISGNNIVQNCHFYQKGIDNITVSLSISGHGNIFRNNLVHNSTRQSLVFSGTGHLVEKNEFFNIGFTEGDGGAIYGGQNMTGYGNFFRYNFIHHNMGVPGKLGRGGIFMDDHQGGTECVGNVFYKCADVAIKYNAGAGHIARDNIFLKGRYGIRVIGGAQAQGKYDLQQQIDANPNHAARGNKEDYVGRAKAFVGEDGWNRSPWKDAYPLMSLVMSDDEQYGRYWPIRYEATNNYYYDNFFDDSDFPGIHPQAMAKNNVNDGRPLSKDDFEDYDKMNFEIKEGKELPNIPFSRIGLYIDENRKTMPLKSYYRNEIRNFFDGINSMPGTTLIMNTGEMIEEAPQDTIPSAPNSEADFLSFNFGDVQVGSAKINTLLKRVDLVVKKGTKRNLLLPIFELSDGATADFKTGLNRDFSKAVEYSVVSEDSSLTNEWKIYVTEFSNNEADIISFNLGDVQVGTARINTFLKRVDLVVEKGTERNGLSPIFELSDGATANFKTGVERDFSEVVTYSVTSEDSSITSEWRIYVDEFTNDEADIISFNFGDVQLRDAVIDSSNQDIKVMVKPGTDLTTLSPDFKISPDAKVDVESGEPRDFSEVVSYLVTSGDGGLVKKWKVSVSIGVVATSNAGFPDGTKIYPVPMTDKLNVEVKEASRVSIQNSMGKEIETRTVTDKIILDTSDLDKGFYILNITNQKSRKTFGVKIIK